MSTLQHISKQAHQIQVGRRALVAIAVAVVAIAAVTVALIVSSGGAAGSARLEVAPGVIAQPQSQSDPKYFATHQRPAPDRAAAEQSSPRSEIDYLAKHQGR